MFSQLFFVLLALILINFTPETGLTFWVENPNQAFQWALAIYLILLIFLYGQSKFFSYAVEKRWRALWGPLVNLELLFFLALYHFGLGAQRFFSQDWLTSYQTPFILASLLLYFLALGWAYTWHAYFELERPIRKAVRTAYHQLLFYVPFCLPFILMSFILDGVEHLPIWKSETLPISQNLFLFLLSLAFLILTFIFLPAFLMICWRCRPLDHHGHFDLKGRLEKMCAALHFRHAGFKIWTVMPHAFTAGIVGVAPPFRYILFTPALLKRFKTEEIEAILIHEIGHNRYRHLLFYPFILFGMLISGALFLVGLEAILPSTPEPQAPVADSGYFTLIMGIFLLYALLMGLYFRLIFGFFSRLFERQADLYIFETPLSPLFLIQSLDRLGVVTGYTHAHPSWHHFSLRERMHFLDQAMENPSLIQRHHRRVKKWLIVYFVALIAGCWTLYWAL